MDRAGRAARIFGSYEHRWPFYWIHNGQHVNSSDPLSLHNHEYEHSHTFSIRIRFLVDGSTDAEPFSRDNTPGNKVQIETDRNLTHVDITRNPHSWRPSPDANSCLEDWREFHFVRSPCGSNLHLTINYRDHTGSEKDLALEFSLLDEIKVVFDKLFEAKVNIPHHSSTVKDTPDFRTDIAHRSIQESTPSVDNVRITLDPNDTIPSLPCKRDSNSMAGSSISLRSEKKIGASTADKRSKRKAGSSSEFRYQSLDRAIKRPHVQEARAGEKRCKTSHS
jgi:hypothetical protein